MNEKGFATILGLCLIFVIALVVKSIQEAEMNHAYETADFEVESALQQAAELGIYAAAAEVRNSNTEPFHDEINTSSGLITVDVWKEKLVITPYDVNYADSTAKRVKENDKKIYWIGYALSSRAEIKNKYRRAFAYITEEVVTEYKRERVLANGIKITETVRDIEDDVGADEKKAIHFMEIATTGDYTFTD